MYFKAKHTVGLSKIRNKLTIGWLLFFLFSAFSFANAQDGYEVRKVKFTGNKTFKKADLLNNINAFEINFIQRITKRKEPYFYNQNFINSDLERLIRFYQSEGFIYVQADVKPVNIDKEKRLVDLQFDIREGAPILVDSISLAIVDRKEINEDSLSKKLYGKFILKEKKRFQDISMHEDIVRINKAFQNKGFAYTQTSYQLEVDTATNTTDVHYATEAGTRSTFGETTITGFKHSREKFIRRQLTYQAGDIYNSSRLDLLRRNLYDLQLYRIISVTPRLDTENKEAPIPIDITLEEMPKISSEFGLGFGTEDRFRAYVDLTYRGVFFDATRLNLYLKHSALEPYHISLKLIQPQFLDKKTSIMINPYFRRQIEPGYDTQTLGVNVPLNRKFSDQYNMALIYYFENVTQRLEDGDVEVPNPESKKFAYSKSGLLLSATYSNALPRYSPEKGFSASMGFKFNGYFFSGEFNYTRLWLDLRNYEKLGDFTLAMRGMIGGIHSSDSTGFIPVEDRFYSGGSNSIRGWGRAQLGPKRDTGTPLGGKSMLELSVELRRRLVWQLDGAVFVDAGNVWSNPYYYRLNDLQYSVGVGLRYKTPIGPVRFDVSMPVWNQKRTPQFFLSVGQAF